MPVVEGDGGGAVGAGREAEAGSHVEWLAGRPSRVMAEAVGALPELGGRRRLLGHHGDEPAEARLGRQSRIWGWEAGCHDDDPAEAGLGRRPQIRQWGRDSDEPAQARLGPQSRI